MLCDWGLATQVNTGNLTGYEDESQFQEARTTQSEQDGGEEGGDDEGGIATGVRFDACVV